MILRWTDEAHNELAAIIHHLESSAPEVARNLLLRVALTEQTISTFPTGGHFDALSQTYDIYVPKTRIILTYAIDDEFIEVIYVWHTSRSANER